MITTSLKGTIPYNGSYLYKSDIDLNKQGDIIFVNNGNHDDLCTIVYCFDESVSKYVEIWNFQEQVSVDHRIQQDDDTNYYIISLLKQKSMSNVYELNKIFKKFIFLHKFSKPCEIIEDYMFQLIEQNKLQITNLITDPRIVYREFLNIKGYNFREYKQAPTLLIKYLDNCQQEFQLRPDFIELTADQKSHRLNSRRMRIFFKYSQRIGRFSTTVTGRGKEPLAICMRNIILKRPRLKIVRKLKLQKYSLDHQYLIKQSQYVILSFASLSDQGELYYENFQFDVTTARYTRFFGKNEFWIVNDKFIIEKCQNGQIDGNQFGQYKIIEFKIQQDNNNCN